MSLYRLIGQNGEMKLRKWNDPRGEAPDIIPARAPNELESH